MKQIFLCVSLLPLLFAAMSCGDKNSEENLMKYVENTVFEGVAIDGKEFTLKLKDESSLIYNLLHSDTIYSAGIYGIAEKMLILNGTRGFDNARLPINTKDATITIPANYVGQTADLTLKKTDALTDAEFLIRIGGKTFVSQNAVFTLKLGVADRTYELQQSGAAISVGTYIVNDGRLVLRDGTDTNKGFPFSILKKGTSLKYVGTESTALELGLIFEVQ